MYLFTAKSLRLNYLLNAIETCIRYSNIKSYQKKDNVFYITRLDVNNNPIELTIKCEMMDDKYFSYYAKFPINYYTSNCGLLSPLFPAIIHLSYYNSGNKLSIFDFSQSEENIRNYVVEVIISNIKLYLEKCGIRFLKYDLCIINDRIKLHTLWYGIITFVIEHSKLCGGKGNCFSDRGNCFANFNRRNCLYLRYNNKYYSIEELCDNNIFEYPIFKQMGIKLQNDKVKCLKILMLTKLLVKEYLCTDLFTEIGILIYQTSFGEQCITGFD